MKFSQPNITRAEIDAVVEALEAGHLATGVKVAQFEQAFRAAFGFEHVVAVNSGTTALILGLQALGIGPGDEVVVTPYSIMATVNCILAVGATPVFCDVERDTYNLDPKKIPWVLTDRTRAILPASIFGVPCDVAGIVRETALPILEDAIEALGSTRAGEPVGRQATVSAFGFFPNKQITTCQGGIVVTADAAVADHVRRMRQHGWGPDASLWRQAYGWNVRLPDPLAAMGVVQLSRLAEMQDALGRVAAMYDERLPDLRRQRVPADCTRTHFIYGVELPDGVNKHAFCLRMEARGVPVRPYFTALHEADHVARWWSACPVAKQVAERTVALPLHYEMGPDDVDLVVAAARECLG